MAISELDGVAAESKLGDDWFWLWWGLSIGALRGLVRWFVLMIGENLECGFAWICGSSKWIEGSGAIVSW